MTVIRAAARSTKQAPASNFTGSVSFTYRASDGNLQSGPATVTINVTGTNTPPTGVGESFSTGEDSTLTIQAPGLLSNDTDADGDTLTATVAIQPAHGSLTLNPDGSITYLADDQFDGTDTFQYKASDGADSNVATVTITLHNLAPVAALSGPAPTNGVRGQALTFTLSALLASRELLLSIAGESKLAVYHRAAEKADEALPVSLILNQTQAPVSVWKG